MPPDPLSERVLRTRPDAIDEAVYSTDIPLIVAERIRHTTTYDDGTRADRTALLATWYALRWLIAAFPTCDGFSQRQIAAIAAIDQKMVYKRLRLLYQLDLIIECGERHYANLTGRDGQVKAQRLYTIPIRELHHLSSAEAPAIVARWRETLFGNTPPPPPPPPANQLTLDLADVCADALRDDPDPLGGSGAYSL